MTIKVLVIDDSALMRAFLGRVVASQPDMELAAVVPDPLLAFDRIRRTAPDVVTLDVEMPGMNGLEFLRKLMAVRPMPVLMISSLTRQGADATLRALELGAVDFFPKPDSYKELDALAEDIADKIRAAAQARIARRASAPWPSAGIGAGTSAATHDAMHAAVRGAAAIAERMRAPPFARVARASVKAGAVIGIGASTGGVEALRVLLAQLPPDVPPVLIAQHMLPGFTDAFARRLDASCAIDVVEARDGQAAQPGCAYIAPGGRHLRLERRAGAHVLRVGDDDPVNRHRPSVDVLFRSMAQAAGAQAVAALLTGMGADGAEGLLALRRAGARTLAQDEASCVVWGMPRRAVEIGAAEEIVSLTDMAARLRELAGTAAPRQSTVPDSSH